MLHSLLHVSLKIVILFLTLDRLLELVVSTIHRILLVVNLSVLLILDSRLALLLLFLNFLLSLAQDFYRINKDRLSKDQSKLKIEDKLNLNTLSMTNIVELIMEALPRNKKLLTKSSVLIKSLKIGKLEDFCVKFVRQWLAKEF